MPDVIEQLHAYADTVTDTVPAVANPRIADLAMPHVRGRRSPVRVAIAVGTGVVLVGGAAWFGVRLSRTTSAPRRVPTTTPTSIAHLRTVTPPPGVQILEPPPLSPRGDSASAWTGSELVIWGGDVEAFNMGLPGPDRMFVDGAAYNLAAHAWRPISNGPLPANATTPVAVATTTEVVIVRGRNVAAWNPTTDTWRSLGDAPADVSDLVSTGQAVLSASANASLDLRSGRWRSLPARPIDFVSGSSVWTGRELVAFGADIFAAAYDPARDAWRKLPNAPEIRGSGSSLSWDGERVIAVDYDDRAASYRPDRNTWTALPRIPVRFAEGGVHASAVAPEAFVLTSGAVAVLDPQDHWVPLPYPTTASMLVPVRAPGQTSPIPTSVFMIGNQYPGGASKLRSSIPRCGSPTHLRSRSAWSQSRCQRTQSSRLPPRVGTDWSKGWRSSSRRHRGRARSPRPTSEPAASSPFLVGSGPMHRVTNGPAGHRPVIASPCAATIPQLRRGSPSTRHFRRNVDTTRSSDHACSPRSFSDK